MIKTICKVIATADTDFKIAIASSHFTVNDEELAILNKASELYTDVDGVVQYNENPNSFVFYAEVFPLDKPKDTFLTEAKTLLAKFESQSTSSRIVEEVKANATQFTKEQITELLKIITNL